MARQPRNSFRIGTASSSNGFNNGGKTAQQLSLVNIVCNNSFGKLSIRIIILLLLVVVVFIYEFVGPNNNMESIDMSLLFMKVWNETNTSTITTEPLMDSIERKMTRNAMDGEDVDDTKETHKDEEENVDDDAMTTIQDNKESNNKDINVEVDEDENSETSYEDTILGIRKEEINDPIQSSRSTSSTNFHIVFSTGCSAFQDWQSYVFFYHVWKSGQSGNVTRLVSGCKNEIYRKKVQNIFNEQIRDSIPTAQDRFHIHFTPDYTRVHFNSGYEEKPAPYNFFNKPWALKHWMEHSLGFIRDSNNTVSVPDSMKSTIIVILDPDQILLKPFTDDYTSDPTVMWHGYGQDWFLAEKQGYKIRKGLPFSQVYAFFGYWVHGVLENKDAVVAAANWSDPTFQHGLDSLTEEDVNNFYIAGPPYIGDASDMYDIVTVWANVVVPVYYFTKKDHLSEMFAYSTAAAFLNLPHQLVYSFMVSNPGLGHLEGWYDQDYNTPNIRDDDYYQQWSNPTYYNPGTQTLHDVAIPNVMHYCQEYKLGPYYFFKYYLPSNILSCSHPLLLEPPSLLVSDPLNEAKLISTNASRDDCGTIAFLYNSARLIEDTDNVKQYGSPVVRKEHAFALCQMIYRLNDAFEFWKSQNCDDDANYEKTYVFEHNKDLSMQSVEV